MNKRVFISENIPQKVEEIFTELGLDIIKLKGDPSLPLPVSTHADMLIFSDGKRLVTTKNYYEKYNEIFHGCNIIITDTELGNKYPQDTVLNCFVLSERLYGRLESVCKDILELYPKSTNLTQGYAKCSTLLFGNNAVTADKGIAKALKKNSITVLEITPGFISLPGYDYGFIGGASFVHENKVIFFGDLRAHPDYTNIRNFIEDRGFEVLYTKDTELIDLGSAVYCNNY